MFEIADFIKARKESKDKITRVISAWSVREETIHEEGFQDGATFGYNKAKEEMQEQGLALQSDMDKTIEQNIQLKNQNNWLEGCKLELAEHLGKANDKISELEQQIEKMKQDLDSAREYANRQEQWEIYSVLNDIYNDNFEVITSISN